ncbi:MAG: DMT family transporter [Microthrixaceae bacterium]
MTAAERQRLAGTAALATATVLWAGSFIATRSISTSSGGFGPFSVLAGRTAIAAAAFAVPALAGRVQRPKRRDLPLVLVTSISGSLGYLVMFHLGARDATAATASLVINLAPVLGMVAAAVALHDRLGRRKLLGIGLAVAGTVPVSLADGGGFRLNAAVAWLVGAAIAAATYVVASKPLVDRYDGLSVTAWGWWISLPFGAAFLPGAVRDATNASASSLGALVYLGLGSSTLAYTAWGAGLRRTTASAAAAWLFAVPVIATLGAWALLGERPGATTALGGTVALIGVWLATGRPADASLASGDAISDGSGAPR